jgi:hypothetical protein
LTATFLSNFLARFNTFAIPAPAESTPRSAQHAKQQHGQGHHQQNCLRLHETLAMSPERVPSHSADSSISDHDAQEAAGAGHGD